MRHALVSALFGMFVVLAGAPAPAATDGGPASAWSETDHSRLRLVAATTTTVGRVSW